MDLTTIPSKELLQELERRAGARADMALVWCAAFRANNPQQQARIEYGLRGHPLFCRGAVMHLLAAVDQILAPTLDLNKQEPNNGW